MILTHPRANPDRRRLDVSIALASPEARAWARTAETTSLGESVRLGAAAATWRTAALLSGGVLACAVFLVAWAR